MTQSNGNLADKNLALLHPATAQMIGDFSLALIKKLAAAEKKYNYVLNWQREGWMDECRAQLLRHVGKGDPLDVAAYCAFLWFHREKTSLGKPMDFNEVTDALLDIDIDNYETYEEYNYAIYKELFKKRLNHDF